MVLKREEIKMQLRIEEKHMQREKSQQKEREVQL